MITIIRILIIIAQLFCLTMQTIYAKKENYDKSIFCCGCVFGLLFINLGLGLLV